MYHFCILHCQWAVTRLYLPCTLSNTACLNSTLITVISVYKQHLYTFHPDSLGKGGAERRHPRSDTHEPLLTSQLWKSPCWWWGLMPFAVAEREEELRHWPPKHCSRSVHHFGSDASTPGPRAVPLSCREQRNKSWEDSEQWFVTWFFWPFL